MATLIVNVLGGFLIGLIMEISIKTDLISPQLKLLLTTGLLGGLTIFSTFSYETLMLIEEEYFSVSTINIILNIFFSLAGVAIVKFIIK